MSSRSVASDALTLPVRDALHAMGQSDKGGPPNALAQLVRILRDHFNNCVAGGVIEPTAPTTASTQATGASGVTVVRVNLPAFTVVVDGVQKSFTAEADRVLHDTTVYTGVDSSTLTSGKSAIITIVAKNASGTVSLVNVKGGTATTGSQVEATDAQIDTAVSSVEWVKVCEVLINRTGDTTITQSQDGQDAPCLGVTQDVEFFNGFTD